MTISKAGSVSIAVACMMLAACGDRISSPDTSGSSNAGDGKGPRSLSTCEMYAGINHCVIGGANLTLTSVLAVTGLGGSSDGVASSMSGIGTWTQRADIAFPGGGGGSVSYAAIASSGTLGSMAITQGSPTDHFAVHPTFSGTGTYSIDVLLHGTSVGGQNWINLDAEPCQIVPEVDVAAIVQPLVVQDNVAGFAVTGNAVSFTTETSRSYSVTLPNGTTVAGDKVVFTGNLIAGVSHTIQEVDVKGLLNGYTIKAETAVP